MIRLGSPPPAGSHTYSSSAAGWCRPKSSRVRMRCIFEPRTARMREPSPLYAIRSKKADVGVSLSGSPSPSARMRQISPPAESFQVTYAIWRPSGDQAAPCSTSFEVVRRRASVMTG